MKKAQWEHTQDELDEGMLEAIKSDSRIGFEVLINAGANVHARFATYSQKAKPGSTGYSFNALHIAAAESSAEMCAALVGLGLDVNEKNGMGSSPVYLACSRDKKFNALMLVALGGSTSVESDDEAMDNGMKVGNLRITGMTRREAAIRMEDIDMFRSIEKECELQGERDSPKALMKLATSLKNAEMIAQLQASAAMHAINSALKEDSQSGPKRLSRQDKF